MLRSRVLKFNLISELKRRIFLSNPSYYDLSNYFGSDISLHTNSKSSLCLSLLHTNSRTLRSSQVFIRTVLTYGSETWILFKYDKYLFLCFERKTLRSFIIFISCHYYTLSNQLRWVGHIERTQNQDPTKRVLAETLYGEKMASSPKTRYLTK